MHGVKATCLILLLGAIAQADSTERNILGGKLTASLPDELEDVSVAEQRNFSTKFQVLDDNAPSFAVTFLETYGTAPRDLPKAVSEQLHSMGLRNSKEHLTQIVNSDFAKFCAAPEPNDSATVWVCLIVPKSDTVKVVAFNAPNNRSWRESARTIIANTKVGTPVRWGGVFKIGANVVKLDSSWTLDMKNVATLTYRLSRRAEFGKAGPSCEISLDTCKDASTYRDELHGTTFEARMTCHELHCDAQVENVVDGHCLLASCDAVATTRQHVELENMFKSVDRLPASRGM